MPNQSSPASTTLAISLPPESETPTARLDAPVISAASSGDGHLTVRSLDLEGQGVAHREDGKVVFIDGALPYEVVSARVHRSKASFDKGTLTVVHQESAQRVRPLCPHFGLHEGACGTEEGDHATEEQPGGRRTWVLTLMCVCVCVWHIFVGV